MKRVALVLAAGSLVFVAAVSVLVQLEAEYVREDLGGRGPLRALVLYHPSRDARFSDDLSSALSEGLQEAGLAVERTTLTRQTPARPRGYAVVGVVSNTYYWTPDLPTLRYLDRARLDRVLAVGLIGGAGSTGRSERLLEEALRGTGARLIETRSFWL